MKFRAASRGKWLGLLLACLACDAGDALPGAPAGLVLRPGDSLFDHLDALAVAGHPLTSLPGPVAEAVTGAPKDTSWSVPADAWEVRYNRKVPGPQRQSLHALVQAYGASFDGADDVGMWRLRVPALLDPALGSWWCRHQGRLTQALATSWNGRQGLGAEQTWLDQQGRTLFWWDWHRRELIAFAREAPGAISYGFGLPESSLGQAEWRLVQQAPAPNDARALLRRQALDFENRPCLLAPTPTRLMLKVAALDCDSLDFTVGIQSLAFGVAQEFLRGAAAPPAVLDFSVDVVVSGVPSRVWSRRVSAAEGWVSDQVDLSSWRGRACTLVLSTSFPERREFFAYALWSGLRFRAVAASQPQRPHLVLIDVDTLRADRLGCYGAERETSPRLDAWASREAMLYTDAVATANWTLPSTVSMLTGLDVEQHGVRDESQALARGVPTVASQLRAAGYETWARTDAGLLLPSFGFAEGFDRYDYKPTQRSIDANGRWQEALGWLKDRAGHRPVFLFFQTYQVHAPLQLDRHFDDPAAPYEGRLAQPQLDDGMLARARRERAFDAQETEFVQALYDAGVRRMDVEAGAFLEALPDVFGADPYLVIFTSDHGEELLDRGRFGHRYSLHTELLGVQLLVRRPDGAGVGRSDAPVTLLDVAPTLLDAAGLEPPPDLPGRSLLGPLPRDRLRVADDRGLRVGLLWDGHKLMWPRTAADGDDLVEHLYDLSADPDELNDLIDAEPDTTRRLLQQWQAYQRRFPILEEANTTAGALDPSLRADLKALGYLGDG